jgi:histidyl-tRNA synthetase
MKSQMKSANKSGAAVAVILGEDEVARGVATVRPMSGGDQTEVPLDDVVDSVKNILRKAPT